ncbi:NAD(+) diphosphatase [Nakamurella flavida]|uniref:NAD(+) diphosphatase n=2 Tax=Nakamurella flavida TaxID=363630 RepID=A0A939C3K6_9ACTN|nr:NAD(+) diphosphatase [Nakamurella flavida]MBM9477151.1 NAD(+) diphosphatase [Nakamurella flavida]
MVTPALSRGTVDRSEDLRDPDRIAAAWPTARVLTLDPAGRAEIRTGSDGVPSLVTVPAPDVAAAVPTEAVLLGAVDGVDHWAVPVATVDGPESTDGWSTEAIPGEDSGPTRLGLRDVGAVLGDRDAGLLTAATALLTWHRRAPFCPACGRPSTPTTAGWARRCPEGHEEFPRTDPAVIMLVHDGAGSMVLARQPSWPPGRVSVLAGFVEAGEALEATVAREIGEEIGIAVTDIAYLGSQPWPFPRSLMVGFVARAERGAVLSPRPGEIEEATWVTREQVRRILAAGGSADGITLPGGVSIARHMVEGWAAVDD